VRIAGNDLFAPDETEEEAQDDLADAVALCLVEPCDLVEPQPMTDVLGDEYALRREICVYARDVHMRVPTEEPRESALMLRLDLVVELISDPLAHLAQQRSRIRTRGQCPSEPIANGFSSKSANTSCTRASRSCSITPLRRRHGTGSRSSGNVPNAKLGTSPCDTLCSSTIESSWVIFAPASPIRRSWARNSSVNATVRASPADPSPLNVSPCDPPTERRTPNRVYPSQQADRYRPPSGPNTHRAYPSAARRIGRTRPVRHPLQPQAATP
jgi:hypothetical protein